MRLNFDSNCLNLCSEEQGKGHPAGGFFKATFLLLIFSLFTAVLPAQQSFERSLSIHSGAVHLGLNGIELPDSSLLAVGVFSDSAQNQRVCLVWTNSTGDTTHTRIVQTNAVREIASKAIRHSSGDLYVAGRTDDTSNSDALLMKLDANGGVQWRHSNGTGSFNERYTTLCSSIDGNFIAGGRSVNLQTNAYYLKSEAVQLSGTSLWSKEWRTRLGEINDVAQAPDSSIYFTGYVLDFGDTSGAMFLMKTNAHGDSLWTKKYFGLGWATGNSLLILPDGILMAGASAASALFAGDHYLVRTNFSGDTLWTRRIGSVNADEKTMDVSFTSDNCYILCGNSRSSLELVKVDTLGNVEWSHDYNSGDASGNSVVATLDSGYFAVGSSSLSTGLPLIYLVKTDATGGILLGETLPEQLTNEIRFYPNPSDGRVYFMPAELRNITVTDFSGKIVYRCEQCSGSLDLSPLSAGAYFLFARSEKGDFMQGKILLTAAH